MRTFAIVTSTLCALVLPNVQDSDDDALATGDKGLPVSAHAPSFVPLHLTGSHSGKRACPLCIHGLIPQLQIWVDEQDILAGLALAKQIDSKLAARSVAYLVVSPTRGKVLSTGSKQAMVRAGLKRVFVTSIPGWDDAETGRLYGHSSMDRGVKVYVIVNRRVYQRWNRPNSELAGNMIDAMKRAEKYVSNYETSDAQIAPPWLKGQRLYVTFRVVDAAGKPMSGIKVSATQTDQSGLYSPPGWSRRVPTLSALCWTNDAGLITFQTVMPGPYPTNTEPSHIHFTATINGKPRWRTLWFEGDPLISSQKRSWAESDAETEIATIEKSGAIWRLSHTFKVN